MVAVAASAPRPFDKVSVNWTNVFGCCSCFCKLTLQHGLEGRCLSGFPFHAGFWTLCDNWHPERLLLPIMAEGLFTWEMKKQCIFCNWQHAIKYTYENKNHTMYPSQAPNPVKYEILHIYEEQEVQSKDPNLQHKYAIWWFSDLKVRYPIRVPDTRNKKEVQRLQIASAFISNSIYMRGKGQILSAEADTKSKKEQIFLSNNLRSFTKH